jgi:hypothetical protein
MKTFSSLDVQHRDEFCRHESDEMAESHFVYAVFLAVRQEVSH